MKIVWAHEKDQLTIRVYEVLAEIHQVDQLDFIHRPFPLTREVAALSDYLAATKTDEFVYVGYGFISHPLVEHAIRRGYHFGILDYLCFPDLPIEVASVFHVDRMTRTLLWLNSDFYDDAEIVSRAVMRA